MKGLGYLFYVVILVFAFVAGYWPQHKNLLQAHEQLSETSAKLANAESAIRLYQLQGKLITLAQETGNKNYADASGLSTTFFNGVRGEVETIPQSDLKSSLQSILNQRDAVTASIARGDPKAHDLLEKLLADLSKSLAGIRSDSWAKK